MLTYISHLYPFLLYQSYYFYLDILYDILPTNKHNLAFY
jgi:hypothetical protein